MAQAGRVVMSLDNRMFNERLEALVHHVERGTKKATEAWCEDVKEMTLEQVPRATGALASSFFYEIHGAYKNFTATIGYGKGNPVNPDTQIPVQHYMVTVHEDLSVPHKIGKAKFLEDPIRQYQKERMLARAAQILSQELR